MGRANNIDYLDRVVLLKVVPFLFPIYLSIFWNAVDHVIMNSIPILCYSAIYWRCSYMRHTYRKVPTTKALIVIHLTICSDDSKRTTVFVVNDEIVQMYKNSKWICCIFTAKKKRKHVWHCDNSQLENNIIYCYLNHLFHYVNSYLITAGWSFARLPDTSLITQKRQRSLDYCIDYSCISEKPTHFLVSLLWTTLHHVPVVNTWICF